MWVLGTFGDEVEEVEGGMEGFLFMDVSDGEMLEFRMSICLEEVVEVRLTAELVEGCGGYVIL